MASRFGLRLPAMVALLVLAWVAAAIAYGTAVRVCYPELGYPGLVHRQTLRHLLAYGGWVQVSNVLIPALCYSDRLFIGSLVSVSALSYYTAPSDAILRTSIVPVSLASALFPAFSSLDAARSRQRLEELCVRSLKSVLLLLGPTLLLVMVFARPILTVWLGAEFAERSTAVLQILAVGVLINALAVLPFSLLQGLGHPRLTASFHLLELPLYLASLWWLVGRMGIVGAAWAWGLRVLLDALLLFGASLELKVISLARLFDSPVRRTAIALSAFAVACWLARFVNPSLLVQTLALGLVLPVFGLIAWSFVLDGRDRELIASLAGQAWTASDKPEN